MHFLFMKRHELSKLLMGLVLISLFSISSCNDYEPIIKPDKIFLRSGWKYHIGNIPSTIPYSDTGGKWKSIKINKPWQDQGFQDYYGFGIYQCKFYLPTRIKTDFAKDTVKIYLGIIGDSDQLFLNGMLIGENAKSLSPRKRFTNDFIKIDLGWITSRTYKIAANNSLLHWNGDNVLTVRVFSNSETGGLKYGWPYVQMQSLSEDLIIDKFRFYSVKNEVGLDTNLQIFNQNKKLFFRGDLTVTAFNMISKSVNTTKFKDVQVAPMTSLSLPISLPETEDSVLVKFRFEDRVIRKTLIDSLMLPFVLTKK